MLSANSRHTVTPMNMIQFLALTKGEKIVLQSTISFSRRNLASNKQSLSFWIDKDATPQKNFLCEITYKKDNTCV